MARPHKIAPCQMKGAGAVKDQSLKSCECARSLQCKNDSWVSYSVDGKGRLHSFPFNVAAPQATHIVTPCDETYLKKKSAGTTLHRKLNPDSDFIGCYDIEKHLLANKLVRYEPREKIGKGLDAVERVELFGNLADFEGFSAEDAFNYMVSGNRRELQLKDLFSITIEVDQLQDQLSYEDLQVPACQNDDDEIERAEQELSDTVRRLLSKLTTKQRNAVRAVYLENYEGLSRATIAHRMGIREDTLNERIQRAFKKLRFKKPNL